MKVEQRVKKIVVKFSTRQKHKYPRGFFKPGYLYECRRCKNLEFLQPTDLFPTMEPTYSRVRHLKKLRVLQIKERNEKSALCFSCHSNIWEDAGKL